MSGKTTTTTNDSYIHVGEGGSGVDADTAMALGIAVGVTLAVAIAIAVVVVVYSRSLRKQRLAHLPPRTNIAPMSRRMTEVAAHQPRTLLESPKSRLCDACAAGDDATVLAMLDDDDTLLADDARGRNPLLLAASAGHTSVVQILVQRGANVNYAGEDEQTALTLACRHRRRMVVKMLLKNGAEPNLGSSNGMTPLHWACMSGEDHRESARIVRLLVRKGASLQVATSDRGVAPLAMACRAGNEMAVVSLLDARASVNHVAADGSCAITDAASLGRAEVVRILAARGADLSVRSIGGRTLVELAQSVRGDAKLARWLRAAQDFNVVHWACETQNVDALKTLLRWVFWIMCNAPL